MRARVIRGLAWKIIQPFGMRARVIRGLAWKIIQLLIIKLLCLQIRFAYDVRRATHMSPGRTVLPLKLNLIF